MNAVSANYLTSSFDNLTRTLLQNRMMKQQEEENIRRDLLHRAMNQQEKELATDAINSRETMAAAGRENDMAMLRMKLDADRQAEAEAADQDYTAKAAALEAQNEWHKNQQVMAGGRAQGEQYRADQNAVFSEEDAKAMAQKWRGIWKQMGEATRATFAIAGIDPENPVFTVPREKNSIRSVAGLNVELADSLLEKENAARAAGDTAAADRFASLRQQIEENVTGASRFSKTEVSSRTNDSFETALEKAKRESDEKRLAEIENVLQVLGEFKKKGYLNATVTKSNIVLPPAWYRHDTSIDELIQQFTNERDALRLKLPEKTKPGAGRTPGQPVPHAPAAPPKIGPLTLDNTPPPRSSEELALRNREGIQQLIDAGLRYGTPRSDGQAPSLPRMKPLTREKAQEFLQQAGGDKNKARELARAAGYAF